LKIPLQITERPFFCTLYVEPQTSCAVSITKRSLLRCASNAMSLSCTLLPKPHWGEGLAPIIVEQLLKVVARITREEGLSAIIGEQHPNAILKISHSAWCWTAAQSFMPGQHKSC
jgi:ABC-type branched-subunit amino acid transport system ATPase component